MLVEIAVVLVLILLNAFFAMSELAIISARRVRLKQRADSGSHGARVALELSDDPTRLLSTVQIGITLIGILAGAFSGATIAERLIAPIEAYGLSTRAAELIAVVLVVAVVTYLSLVIGELVPKRIALTHSDAIATRVSRVINFLARVAHPGVVVLRLSTDALLRLLGLSSPASTDVTDEEINALIAEGAEQGVIEPLERQMVEEVLKLADRPVRTIMTHRRDLVWLDVNDSAEIVRRKIADTGFNRFPICAGELDNCLGYARTRAVVHQLLEGGALDLQSLLRPALMVSKELKTLELMAMFRRARPHVALVTDEYGSILGMVTPADILETIVGDLAEEAGAQAQVVARADGSWLVDAQIELQDLERALDSGGLATGEEFKTLAGLILEQLGHMPRTADVVIVNGWRLEIVDLDGYRIDKVAVSRLTGRGALV